MTRSFHTIFPWFLLALTIVVSAILLSGKNAEIETLNQRVANPQSPIDQRTRTLVDNSQPQVSATRTQATAPSSVEPKDPTEEILDQQMDQQFEQSLDRIAETYVPLFRQLGMNSDARIEMAERLAEIEDIRAQATKHLHQLQISRLNYDREMRNILSDSQYDQYREFEDRRHSEELLAGISNYGRENGLSPLSSDQAAKIQRDFIAFQGKAGADDSFGPYGDSPTITVGLPNIEKVNNDRLGRMEGERDQLAELNPTAAPQINEFYNKQIDRVEKQTKKARQLDQETKSSK